MIILIAIAQVFFHKAVHVVNQQAFSREWKCAFLLVMTLAFGHPNLSQADSPGEYQVKAAFLYHFTQFIEWPQSHFTPDDGPLQLCVVEPDPFGSILDTMLNGKSVGAHGFLIKHNPSTSELGHCHVLFLPKAHGSLKATLRASFAHTNVLTVGEDESFLEEGGMIQFFFENQKIRFAINSEAVKLTQLKVSAKLLRLAKIVNP
ncbi:MAG: YfiR family protein [Nitrospirota bacterium]|nr:YfiR family protein [Nitrospirota bacterium]MDH5699966.1 YfiR family protein [Nitrospirota bacterium]